MKPMFLTVHIMGPSGSGKSSLVEDIANRLKEAGIEFTVEDPIGGGRITDWTDHHTHSLSCLEATEVAITTQTVGWPRTKGNKPRNWLMQKMADALDKLIVAVKDR